MKKIISLLSAFALTAAFIPAAFAAETTYGTPELALNAYQENVEGDDYILVDVNYSGFTGFQAYSALKGGKGIVLAQFFLTSDELECVAIDASGDWAGAVTNEVTGAFAKTATDSAIITKPEGTFATYYFVKPEGFDLDKDSADFKISSLKITCGNTKNVAGDVTYTVTDTANTVEGDAIVITVGKADPEPKADYEVAEKGYGVDAEETTVASYYTIMFNNGLTADNATIAISKDATKDWTITDLPTIDAGAKITWVFQGLTDGLYDVVKVLDGETELSAE